MADAQQIKEVERHLEKDLDSLLLALADEVAPAPLGAQRPKKIDRLKVALSWISERQNDFCALLSKKQAVVDFAADRSESNRLLLIAAILDVILALRDAPSLALVAAVILRLGLNKLCPKISISEEDFL